MDPPMCNCWIPLKLPSLCRQLDQHADRLSLEQRRPGINFNDRNAKITVAASHREL